MSERHLLSENVFFCLVELYFPLAAFGRLALSGWNIIYSLSGSERAAKGADFVHSHITLFKRFPSFSTKEVKPQI